MNLRKIIRDQNEQQNFELQLKQFFSKLYNHKPLTQGTPCQKES